MFGRPEKKKTNSTWCARIEPKPEQFRLFRLENIKSLSISQKKKTKIQLQIGFGWSFSLYLLLFLLCTCINRATVYRIIFLAEKIKVVYVTKKNCHRMTSFRFGKETALHNGTHIVQSINLFSWKFHSFCWLWLPQLHSFSSNHVCNVRIHSTFVTMPYAKVLTFFSLLFYSHFINVIHTKKKKKVYLQSHSMYMPNEIVHKLFLFECWYAFAGFDQEKRKKKFKHTFHIENRFINAYDVITMTLTTFLPMASNSAQK